MVAAGAEAAVAEVAPSYRGLKRNYRCSRSLEPFYSRRAYAVASDGSFLACAYDDKVKLVNVSNAAVRATLDGDTEEVTALVISPDDKFLFSASASRLVRVWDISSAKCVRSWKANDGIITVMTCHASGGLLATAGSDKKVLVWDVDGGFCTHFFKGHEGVITSVIFHPDPNRLLLFSGSEDETARIWNLESKKCIAVLKKHFSAVTSLTIAESCQLLLSAGRDKVVNMWDLHDYSHKKTLLTYEVLETIKIINPGSQLAACMHRVDSARLKKKQSGALPFYFLTAGERGIVRIWSSDSDICLYEQSSSDATISSDTNSLTRFISVAILHSHEKLLCVTDDQQFLVYNLIEASDGQFHLNLQKRLIGYNVDIIDMKFVGEEEQLLAVAALSEEVRIYDVASMSCSYALAGHTDTVLCLDTCVLNNGNACIVTGSKDNSVRLWNVVDGKCIGVASGHTGAVGAVAFSRKYKNFFVSGSSDIDRRHGIIKVWTLDNLFEAMNHETKLKSKAVVAGHDKDINCLAISPNDSLACSGSQDRTACVWRLPDLVSVVVLKGHKRGIWSVEFSPVDQCVITASGDRTIKCWLISDGSCLRTFEGHTSSVLRASFITHGMQIISCGADGLVKLWTVKTSECAATYDQHEGKVWSLAVGKKTEMLATGGSDSVINLWHDCTADDIAEKLRKAEEDVLKDQELENAFLDRDYAKTIQLAFELRKPHKLFKLLSEVCREEIADDPIQKVVQAVGKEELHLLLEFIREWNTKPQLCHVAQSVLFRVFKVFPPTEIIKVKGIRELLEGLIPYSQRHFGRIDRLSRSIFLLDYTLSQMSVLEPETSAIPAKDDNGNGHASEKIALGIVDSSSNNNIVNEQMQGSSDDGNCLPKKRKSNKSRKGPKKRVKDAGNGNLPAIPVQG